eukprot:TRINITY_DN5343_c0_g1_i1.p1 TRINITY_DN5343_c0_g1~~TRINITY_DN5343_c0_g1_i1.p1  ORF type:complete len:410 (+),score=156.06 TRINITY_DN5343_c0_g1_i1:50-1279(+)
MFSKAVNAYSYVSGWVGHKLSTTAEQDYTPKTLTTILRNEGLLQDGEEVTSVELVDLSGRGFVGAMYEVKLQYNTSREGLEKKLIVKTCSGAMGHAMSIGIRGYREGLFYSTYGRTTYKDFATPALYSYSNSYTGKYSMLMKDMREGYIGVNLLFGNQIWGLPDGFDRSQHMDEKSVLKVMFETVAKLHAKSWNDKDLMKVTWLGGVDWLQQRGKVWWDLALQKVRSDWKNRRASVSYPERVVRVIDASLEASTFENMQQAMKGKPIALCHGDWHAANMFINKDGDLRLCDWCDISVWNPMRDVSQFIISDLKIKEHGASFPDLLKLYRSTLQDLGVDLSAYPYEESWKDFVAYGISRWVYFIPIMDAFPNVPDKLLEYFSNQMLDFLEATGCTEDETSFPIMTVVGIY